jgi:uncharacterized protein YndB with AHSA1/START domain
MAKVAIVAEPGKQEIITTRVFNASRDRVFKVYTDPELLPQWWGPSYLTTTVDKMEVKDGGSWRFVQKDAEGNEYAFRGVYHSIRPEQIVGTFEWEGLPGHVLMETVTLEEKDGQTILKSTSVFQSVEDRDGMLQSGMEDGADESMDKLTQLIESV